MEDGAVVNDAAADAARGPQPLRTPIFAPAERTIDRVLARNAERYPDKVALRQEDVALTHAEVRAEADRRGSALAALGVGWQERVLMMMDNHLDHVLTWLGATYHGRVQVQVNTAYRGRLLAHVVDNAGCDTMVLEQGYCARLAEIADEVPGLRRLVVRGGDGAGLPPGRFEVLRFEEVLADGPGGGPERQVEPWDVYGILYTSGTTGLSKGVVIPHGQPYSYTAPDYFRLADHDDVVLVTLAQFHIGGQWAGVMAALFVGGTAVIVDGFSTSRFWEDVRRFGATHTCTVSTMADFLFRRPEQPDDADNPLRKVLMAPIIAEAAEFERRFGVQLCVGLGQTEASCPIVGPYGTATPGGSGWARPDFDVRVVDEHDLDVAPGEAGEMVVRPREPWSVMLEYNGNLEATRDKWRNLWLHTGDMVRQDEEGQFFFVDRNNDAIRRRGENISSYEVEVETRAHPDVLEVAAIGVPSENYESEVMVFVKPVDGASVDPAELQGFLKQRLPYFMVPRFVEVVDEFEKTITQRINKAVLREAGVGPATWDAREFGLEATRHG